MSQPPRNGPIIGAPTTPRPNIAIAMPCFSRGKLSSRIACESGCSAPPPAPCRMRASTSTGMLQANAHKNEAKVNNAVHASRNRLRPKRSDSQPLAGSTMAFATR